MESFEQEFFPKVFQRTITSLLKNKRSFKADFLAQVKELYQIAEDAKNSLVNQLSREELIYTKIDCQKGCSYCCGMDVQPTMPELYLIFEHIRDTYSEQEIDKLIQDLLHHVERCGNSQSTIERINVKCVFLKNNICSIEKIKPLACRSYTSNDVEKCKAFLENPQIDIPKSICHHAPFDFTRKAIMKSLYFAGFTDVTEELNSGLLRLLQGEYGDE